MNRQELERRSEQILHDTDTFHVPIEIQALAHRLNITTEAASLGDNISGVLVVEKGRVGIGYNSAHALVRQRFTIAHEIAHYVLHVKKNGRSQLFIDQYVAFRRDDHPPTGNIRAESEANRFGAALLMPEGLIRQAIKKNALDLDDEEALSLLAKRFQVSPAAMTIRLIHLGLSR
jgi:Zn-dependent peptidase ImmA (M78 family)